MDQQNTPNMQNAQNTPNTQQNGKNRSGIAVGIIAAAAILWTFRGNLSSGGRAVSKAKVTDLTSSPYVTPDCTLDSWQISDIGAGQHAVTGTVTMQGITNGHAVEIKFYNSEKSLLDTKYDFSPVMQKGERWQFEVYMPSDSAYYEITRVTFVQH